MWTKLCGGFKWAPSRSGLAKPAIPTSNKTIPRILQTVFAMVSFSVNRVELHKRPQRGPRAVRPPSPNCGGDAADCTPNRASSLQGFRPGGRYLGVFLAKMLYF